VIVYTEVVSTVEVVTAGGVATLDPVAEEDEAGGSIRDVELAGGERGVLEVDVGVVSGPEDEVEATDAEEELAVDEVVTAELVDSEDDVDVEVEEAELDEEETGGAIV
jgi:hypothetical protein